MDSTKHEEPFDDLLGAFTGLHPFERVAPNKEEQDQILAEGQRLTRLMFDSNDRAEQSRLWKDVEAGRKRFEKLQVAGDGLIHPVDVFYAARKAYAKSDFALGVACNRVRRHLGVVIDDGQVEDEVNGKEWPYPEFDAMSWFQAQVWKLDLMAVCTQFILDSEGTSDLHRKWKSGFTKGFSERPRLHSFNALCGGEPLANVRKLDPGTAEILEQGVIGLQRLHNLRNEMVHGWVEMSLQQSYSTNQWVANFRGWADIDQIVDLEAFVSRTSFRARELGRSLAQRLATHLGKKHAGFTVAPGMRGRSGHKFWKGLEHWVEEGRLREHSMALRVSAESEALLTKEFTSRIAAEASSCCSKNHVPEVKLQKDSRGRCVLSAACSCGPWKVSESIEAAVSLRFIEVGPGFRLERNPGRFFGVKWT